MDDAQQQRAQEQLENLVAETSAASAELKRRIKELEKKGGTGRDANIRQQQVWLVVFVLLTYLCLCCRQIW